jgi:integrase
MAHTTRLEANRSGRWELRWTEGTRTRSRSTGTTSRSVAEAYKREWDRQERENELALAGKGTGNAGNSVGALIDAYEPVVKVRGVGDTQIGCLVKLRAYFGCLAPDEITPEVVGDYGMSRGVGGGTLRRELNALVAVLNWGVKHGKIKTAPKIDLPDEGAPRATFLDETTESDLWSLASRDVDGDGRLTRVGLFICIGLETGARRSAIQRLTWDRVNLAQGLIDFRDPALRVTKKRRVATPITSRLRPVIERAQIERRKGERFVLAGGGSIKKTWATFMARHGFVGVTPHVLCHTRITLLLRGGVPVWDVGTLTGRDPDVIHAVYGHHVADDRLRALADRRWAPAGAL